MNESVTDPQADTDIGDYCRQVEEYLARTNQGHLVRIVGASFMLVREWALLGIPLSVVYRGIDQKAERHRAGTSKRPLRLEFCEGDVRALFDDWRRAVGVTAYGGSPVPEGSSGPSGPGYSPEDRRRPSLTKHIDRATERLVRAAGRLDLPDAFRETMTRVLEHLVVLREQATHARGPARDAVATRVASLDRQLIDAAREAGGPNMAELTRVAEAELAGYRDRMPADAWQRSVEASIERLLRDRFALPTLDPEVS